MQKETIKKDYSEIANTLSAERKGDKIPLQLGGTFPFA